MPVISSGARVTGSNHWTVKATLTECLNRQGGKGTACTHLLPRSMSLLPGPAASASRSEFEPTGADGRLGGPSHAYRGAFIECQKRGHVCRLRMDGHPLDGHSFGAAGTITPLVDLWVDEGRLPSYMRAVPKAVR